ncbi:MAG TPA: hypothetical protein VGL86_07770, partial [Polyangia bacterium]
MSLRFLIARTTEHRETPAALERFGAQLAHEIGQQREGVTEGIEVGNLAADVHVDAGDLDAL